MSYTAFGFLCFSKSELDAKKRITTYMVGEAEKRDFGVFLGEAVPQAIKKKLIRQQKTFLNDAEAVLPFCLSDSFGYCTCEKIFQPIFILRINEPEKRQADVSQTIFPQLQEFFSAVLSCEEIERICFFWDGDGIEEDYRRVICEPHQLCEMIEKELEITGSFEPSLFIELIK